MDPNLVAFMNTSTYRGRVIWGSDDPWFPMQRSLDEARALPLDDEAMALFLGGTAARLFDRSGDQAKPGGELGPHLIDPRQLVGRAGRRVDRRRAARRCRPRIFCFTVGGERPGSRAPPASARGW